MLGCKLWEWNNTDRIVWALDNKGNFDRRCEWEFEVGDMTNVVRVEHNKAKRDQLSTFFTRVWI